MGSKVNKFEGRIYPMFFSNTGEMHSIRMSTEQLDLFQSILPSILAVDGKIIIDPDPIGAGYKLINKSDKIK